MNDALYRNPASAGHFFYEKYEKSDIIVLRKRNTHIFIHKGENIR